MATTGGKRRPFDDVARAILKKDRITPNLISGSTPGGAIGDDAQLGAWANPMTDIGDIIAGDESGSAIRVGIGTEDQVLTVVDVAGDLRPQWADAAESSGGHYLQPTWTRDGGGELLFNLDGDLILDLQELEP